MDCLKVSSFSWKKFCALCVQEFPSNESVKEEYSLKDVILPLLALTVQKLLQVGTYMLLVITSTGDRRFRFINIDDIERPWTPQKESFSEFFLRFLDAAHISTLNCNEMAGDRPYHDNLRIKFSALNVNFNSLSHDSLGSRRSAQAGVKDGYPPPLRSGYFTAISLCSVKTVANRHRHAADHNKQ